MDMPAMPGMPAIPSISAGGGGPSTAKGDASNSSGYDGSNWAVNFSGNQTPTQTSAFTPQTTTTSADQFGLPNMTNSPAYQYASPSAGQGVAMSPALLIGALLVVALIVKKRH